MVDSGVRLYNGGLGAVPVKKLWGQVSTGWPDDGCKLIINLKITENIYIPEWFKYFTPELILKIYGSGFPIIKP